MDRTELIVATAILLFGAFCLGFLAHWAVNRLSHVSRDDLGELDRLAEQLHAAEEARDTAIAQQKSGEARINRLESELRTATRGMHEARRETEELKAHLARHSRAR